MYHSDGVRHSKQPFRVIDVFCLPQAMISPVKNLPLTLYLTSINKSIGALLAQEVGGGVGGGGAFEHPIYYLSRSL